jgi:DNA-binding winged helix-turn-helix (wHTH) protein
MKMPKEPPKTPNQVESECVYEFGLFRFDAERRRLWRNGDLVALTPKALDTLLVLVRHAGRVVEKDELMRLVWPDSFVIEDNLIQNISALRKALGDSSETPECIATVPRRGYRFVPRVKAKGHDGDADEQVRGNVSVGPISTEEEEIQPEDSRRVRTNRERFWMIVSVLFCLSFVVTLGVAISLVHPMPVPADPVRFLV